MARPTSDDAQFARLLDKLVANAPWLSPDERQLVAKRRKKLVRAVEADMKREAAEREKASRGISGRPRGG